MMKGSTKTGKFTTISRYAKHDGPKQSNAESRERNSSWFGPGAVTMWLPFGKIFCDGLNALFHIVGDAAQVPPSTAAYTLIIGFVV